MKGMERMDLGWRKQEQTAEVDKCHQGGICLLEGSHVRSSTSYVLRLIECVDSGVVRVTSHYSGICCGWSVPSSRIVEHRLIMHSKYRRNQDVRCTSNGYGSAMSRDAQAGGNPGEGLKN